MIHRPSPMNLTGPRALLGLVSVAAAGFFAPADASAQVALHEWDFATLSSRNLAAYGVATNSNWAGWGAQGGTVVADIYTNYDVPGSGAVPRLQNHSVAGADSANGVLFAHSSSDATAANRNDRFVVTTTFDELDLGADNLSHIAWEQAFTNTASFVRVLVQVDGAWYASNTQFLNSAASGAGSMTNAETKTLDLTGALGLGTTAWRSATFGDGLSIAISGTDVETPIGTSITGLGFFLLAGNAANRAVFIDNVALVAIPEPSAAAALLGGFFLASCLITRRRR